MHASSTNDAGSGDTTRQSTGVDDIVRERCMHGSSTDDGSGDTTRQSTGVDDIVRERCMHGSSTDDGSGDTTRQSTGVDDIVRERCMHGSSTDDRSGDTTRQSTGVDDIVRERCMHGSSTDDGSGDTTRQSTGVDDIVRERCMHDQVLFDIHRQNDDVSLCRRKKAPQHSKFGLIRVHRQDQLMLQENKCHTVFKRCLLHLQRVHAEAVPPQLARCICNLIHAMGSAHGVYQIADATTFDVTPTIIY
ncbi:uncharacterized protein B0H18DRAFT_960545 [Fomitopsis serialis]|uniref:uncharacterized protein n=1 Tax=Fomitopsis serialis TaxID=139415 RepID=UPI0020087FB9|nr:uncharacterized protein B0H18DRAFT_960545 [Neoantrodia serialis]KAH9913179.1 hypothetical protein B0H18DRAFT_960545 [Neoantrodia serialis]